MNFKTSRAVVISAASCLISFLLLLTLLHLTTFVRDSLASSSSWLEFLGFKDPQWATIHPMDDVWTPPAWFPSDAQQDLWTLEGIDEPATLEKGPSIRARSAFVYDLDRGEVLYSKDADGLWPVASLTKVVSALTVASEGGDFTGLEQEFCMDREIRPSLPGAKTRFSSTSCYSGWDLYGSAMVSSDNGAALAFPKLVDLTTHSFVEQMNLVAKELNMKHSNFVDPAGMNDENLSTARDITKAMIASAFHPMVSISVSAPSWYSKPKATRGSYRRNTTNKMISDKDVQIMAAKTGYTFTADGCFSTVLRKNGRTFAITVLGTPRPKYRWSDTRKLLSWAMSK